MFSPITGGCLCGHVRYRIECAPLDAGYCHCRRCQKSSGAPVLAWLTVAAHGFAYTGGAPSVYCSSRSYQREFCPHCGTQLIFCRSLSPRTIDVTLASLDDTSVIAPQYHIWMQSRVSWLRIDDTLPRFEGEGPKCSA
ncbi:GFA family protein [Zobellella aerophila]|uniref:GFA family protein n=1 Tax=Zobellella aerophila TaxID=870480 RepID=UPI0031F1A27F